MVKSVILLSGGLDSLVSLGLKKEELNIIHALTFDYGQKSVKKEIEASENICRYYNIKLDVIKLDWLKNITKTSLVSSDDIPTGSELSDAEASAKSVWVPNRNGLFLNIAASFADSFGYDYIIIGANKEEAQTFSDNTTEFVDAVNKEFVYSTQKHSKVVAPLINYVKNDIVMLALKNNIPLDLTMSCYQGGKGHCGICESCTRLKKALEAHVKPIVVVNKVDRPNADPARVVDEVLDLFIELGAPDEFLEFKTIYCSALKGTSSYSPKIEDQAPGMDPIFESIISEIPEPRVTHEGPLQFQPALLDYNDFVGKIGIGLVKRGTIHENEMVSVSRLDGSVKNFRIQKLFGFLGLNRIEIKEAQAGDIIAVAGIPDLNVGETICELNNVEALPLLRIDPPTLQMTFGVNSSPFAGQDGKLLTFSKIEERLQKEGYLLKKEE